MAHLRSYNPGKDDRWKERGRRPQSPIQDTGLKMEEANARHMAANAGQPLPWFRFNAPMSSMKPEDREEAELLAHVFPGTNEIRTDEAGARWWHLRTNARIASMTGLLKPIEETAAQVAAAE